MYGVIVSESSMNKYNIFADPLCFEIRNRRQGPKTAGYRRKLFRTLVQVIFYSNISLSLNYLKNGKKFQAKALSY
jgi:hypothetical protein